MKYFGKYLSSLVLFLMLFTSCEKEKETASKILASVDLNEKKINDEYFTKYIAAYTTDGELIDYGCLTDSVKWEIRGICTDDKIDIVYFEVGTIALNNPCYVEVHHFRNVSTGCSFIDPYRSDQETHLLNVVLKVEDFGNYVEEPDYSEPYEMWPHMYLSGYRIAGFFSWDKIEDGYAYKKITTGLDADELGLELVIFERGTNQPYITSIENSASDLTKEDTIELKQSDFNPGEFCPIQVNSTTSEADLMLITFNSNERREDLITSLVNSSGNSVRYVSSDILPISHWEFVFGTAISKRTSYIIHTNSDIPTSIDIKELAGCKFWRIGNQLCLTHAQTFSGKNLARSSLQLAKYKIDGACIYYTIYINGIESVGDMFVMPIKIPEEIIVKKPCLTELDNMDWIGLDYCQVYTDVPENSPIDYLKNTLMNLDKNDSSTDEFIYEEFKFNL